uniref:Uncharacterized protein n=1 Tax=Nelumbo nucifera TaxID=4432 RepID=A0A822XF11_NELNU|nr:TPA_asm: hypothetical protein HUJ06_021507 [Nelumbo nucifera]
MNMGFFRLDHYPKFGFINGLFQFLLLQMANEENQEANVPTNEHSRDDIGGSSFQAPSSSRRRQGPGRRGCTILPHVQRRSREQAPTIKMDKLGRPIGAHRPELVSYIGVLVRDCSKVLAYITDWRTSPYDVRDRVHNAIREKFIIENELSEEDLLRLARK